MVVLNKIKIEELEKEIKELEITTSHARCQRCENHCSLTINKFNNKIFNKIFNKFYFFFIQRFSKKINFRAKKSAQTAPNSPKSEFKSHKEPF